MTKTNPTAAEFAAALATHEAAERELNALAGHHGEEYNQAEQRYRAAFEAVVRDVRPTDLPSVVRQLRWYLEEIGGGIDDEPMLMHIAAQLEAIGAPRPMPGGDLANLWRQRQQAFAEYASFDDESAKKDVAHDRLCEIDDQIRAARPTDLAGLAIQLQAVLDRPLDSDSEVLEHIAQQLEAMAVPAPTRDDPHPAWFAEMMGERRARQSGNWSEERYRDSLLSECEMQTRKIGRAHV